MSSLEQRVDELYEHLGELSESDTEARGVVETAIGMLDDGSARVAEIGESGDVVVNEWLKRAILCLFRLRGIMTETTGPFEYADRLPLKHGYEAAGVRVVPGASARWGSYLGPGVILMPSYVNIGARVGARTLVDTWATVGSCAQIGEGVHLSGGVGIGGVLEPANAQPVIVEDGVFVGSRVVVVEGMRIGREAVIGAGVVLTSSTAILDVSGPEVVEHRGYVPPRSVVIPGTRAKKFPAGEYGVPCALVIGQRTAGTDRKVSLNEALRDFAVPV